jgi:hypothetical protein
MKMPVFPPSGRVVGIVALKNYLALDCELKPIRKLPHSVDSLNWTFLAAAFGEASQVIAAFESPKTSPARLTT